MSSLSAQNKNWKIVDTQPRSKPNVQYGSYQTLKCADSLNCIVYNNFGSGAGHYFRRTTDGGDSWKTVYTDTINYEDENSWVNQIRDIDYPNTKLFIAVGDSGLLLRSTDNGETWEHYTIDNIKFIFRIRMFDEFYGFMAGYYIGDSTFLMQTSDGGLSWKFVQNFIYIPTNILNRNQLYDIRYLKTIGTTVVLFCDGNYQNYDTIPCPGTTRGHFINERQGWIASGDKILDSAGWQKWTQRIYHTEDGGKTWETQRDTIDFNGEPIVDIRFYDENFGIATSYLGVALITTNGGKYWKEEIIDSFPENDGIPHYVDNIQLLNSTTALVIEEWRLIYKYTREPTDVVETELNSIFSVSPNPAEDFIEINKPSEGLEPSDGYANVVRIFNVFGELVSTSVCSADTSASGGQKINVSGLPSGVYFVRIGVKVGKFVKI